MRRALAALILPAAPAAAETDAALAERCSARAEIVDMAVTSRKAGAGGQETVETRTGCRRPI
jgi:hypothetical protein